VRRLPPLLSVLAMLVAADALAEEDQVEVGALLRTDSDGTHVISPSARTPVGLLDDETHADAQYAADIWASASIDVRTAATVAVSEQRDELFAELHFRESHAFLSGSAGGATDVERFATLRLVYRP